MVDSGMAALWTVTVMLGGAAGSKFKAGNRHALFGPGKLYPGWFAYVAGVQELLTVVLLHVDRPLGLLGCAALLGGICYTLMLPKGPVAHKGPVAAVPCAVLAALLWHLTQRSAGERSPALGALGLPQDLQQASPAALAAATIGGVIAGLVMRPPRG
eukprot:TRINITY_DN47551_c0_g1_i1.p1 TRINITY_DN47551_c0_g1~~TRINITY_DN47551_c0_g1_i1.p1  ORF type:complete len:182 (+),score=64.19 TRINITY_DN47551_c0_g1_i1:78-548(+)